jgi:hypothetical protein
MRQLHSKPLLFDGMMRPIIGLNKRHYLYSFMRRGGGGAGVRSGCPLAKGTSHEIFTFMFFIQQLYLMLESIIAKNFEFAEIG